VHTEGVGGNPTGAGHCCSRPPLGNELAFVFNKQKVCLRGCLHLHKLFWHRQQLHTYWQLGSSGPGML
jgi:hypothetical protein